LAPDERGDATGRGAILFNALCRVHLQAEAHTALHSGFVSRAAGRPAGLPVCPSSDSIKSVDIAVIARQI